MALHNPPSLFTGGAVLLDSRPETQLYAQLMARRQAKNEALDQYYQNLHKNINPKGMRVQEINGGWSQKVADWQKHFIQNKQKIANPKTPEDRAIAIQNEAMYNDILMDTQKSIEAGAHELEYGKLKMSGKANPTENDLKVAAALSESIYSPNHYKDQSMLQPYTINDFDLNVPQFDPKQQEEFYKASVQGLTGGKIYDEKAIRKQNGQLIVPYEQSFTPDQIKTIGDRAASLIDGSRSAQVHYEHLMHDAAFQQSATPAYQSVYGKDQLVDTPKKAAQAAIIMAAQQERLKGEEIRKDEDLAFNRQAWLAKQRLKWANDYILARDSFKSSKNAKVIDEYVESQYNDPDAERGYVTSEGKRYEGKFVKVPKVLTDKYSINVGTKDDQKWIDPQWLLTDDKKHIVPVYPTGVKTKSGDNYVKPESKPIGIADYKVTLSNDWLKSNRTAAEIADEVGNDEDEDNNYGNTVSSSSTNIVRSSGSTNTPKKNYSLKGKSYSYDQIKAAADKSGMTVDQYIQKAGLK